MKAVVSKFLNVRSGEPKVLPNNNIGNKFFKPGDTIDIAGEVEGETYKGNNIWYKLTDGTFVWSGGVDSSFVVPAGAPNTSNVWNFIPEKMSWPHKSFGNGNPGIVDVWNTLQTRGEGVSICILDTGLTDKRKDFGNVKASAFRNVFDTVSDDDGHGTNCTSIAGATGNNIFCGVAPDADLYHYKCFAGKDGQISSDFNTGLNDLLTKNWPIDILSVSFSFQDMDQNTLGIFEQLSKKYIIFAAVQHKSDDVTIPGINNNQIPACFENVIPVCALSKQNVPMAADLLTGKTIYALPGEAIECIGRKGQLTTNGQSSIATPLAAGFFAVIISYLRKRGRNVTPANFSKVLNFFSKPMPYTIDGQDIELYSIDSTKTNTIINLENQLL